MHGLFARRELAHVEHGIEFVVEGAGQHAARLAPFVEQHLHDLEFVLVAKHPAVDPLFHDRQRVAYHQLVDTQATVEITGTGFGHDAAGSAQLAAVGDEPDVSRQRDEFLERQARRGGDAGDGVFEAAANGFAAGDALRHQDVIEKMVGMAKTQPDRAVGRRQRTLVLQHAQEFAGAVQVLLLSILRDS